MDDQQKLYDLASKVSDAGDDFAFCLCIASKAEGVIAQMIEFLRNNPAADTSKTLDHFDFLVDGVQS